MKYLILLLFLTGCSEATKTIKGAEEFCKDKGGVMYHVLYDLTICRNGSVARG